ncbi:hypothetical protein VaNZ11_008948, partial [Volvox africanus]
EGPPGPPGPPGPCCCDPPRPCCKDPPNASLLLGKGDNAPKADSGVVFMTSKKANQFINARGGEVQGFIEQHIAYLKELKESKDMAATRKKFSQEGFCFFASSQDAFYTILKIEKEIFTGISFAEISANLALSAISITLLAGLDVLLLFMLKPAADIVVFINLTQHRFEFEDATMVHGKAIAATLCMPGYETRVPDMVPTGMYIFNKKDGALFGSQGAFRIRDDTCATFSVGVYNPLNGSNRAWLYPSDWRNGNKDADNVEDVSTSDPPNLCMSDYHLQLRKAHNGGSLNYVIVAAIPNSPNT